MEPRIDFYFPSNFLKPYVKRYYLFEGPRTTYLNRVPAWTKSILAIQCGGILEASIGKGGPVRPATLNGLATSPYQITTKASYFKFFIVEFTPVGMFMLFRDKGEYFADNSIDIFDVIPGRKKSELSEALSEVHDMARKVMILESFLRQLLPTDQELHRIRHVVDGLNILHTTEGTISIKEMAAMLKFTPKHMRKGFKEVTGCSPKKYAQILRFNGTFNKVMEGKHPLSANSYFDQSHMIREFKSFTSFSPNAIPHEEFAFAKFFTSF